MPSTAPHQIAVVGIGCRYGDVAGPRKLLENFAARRQGFRRILDCRLPPAQYYDPDPLAPDKTYGRQACYVENFRFDGAKYDIPRSTADLTDDAQWMALVVADEALRDAGYGRGAVPLDKTAVIVGNTLTGEQSRASAMRLRWPFVAKTLRAAAAECAWQGGHLETLLAAYEPIYKSVFPEITEDALAGGLSNTIAGRIANHFDFHGGAYVVDGACASSLLAVEAGLVRLATGDVDMAVVGGVDISLDSFELIGFAKAGALAKGRMHVYDERAEGFIPGEGCGFVVLKRLEDALRDGNAVYAVIEGWGVSSDGRGGITAPSVLGQQHAILRAYESAGLRPGAVDMIEGHGTGTPLGDQVELKALAAAFGDLQGRRIPVTSAKSVFGHTKAASGVLALIKAVLAVNRRLVLPSAGCDSPHKVFDEAAHMLYVARSGRRLDPHRPMRASCSGMGFGGINTHMLVASGPSGPHPRLTPAVDETALLVSHQPTELFVLGAASPAALAEQAEQLADDAGQQSEGALADLSAELTNRLGANDPMRAAVIAASPDELDESLRDLAKVLRSRLLQPGDFGENDSHRVLWGYRAEPPKLGFLFPGQGSQQLLMGRVVVNRHSWGRELLEKCVEWTRQAGGAAFGPALYNEIEDCTREQLDERRRALADTRIAQPAVCFASLAYARLLREFGVAADALAGHSLGELTALHMAGVFDESQLLWLAARRASAMAEARSGGMVSLDCGLDEAERIVAQVNGGGFATVANVNAPRQTVVAGDESGLAQTERFAKEGGIRATRLPVSGAFHSRLMDAAAHELRSKLASFGPVDARAAKVVSSMTGQALTAGVRLDEHLGRQLVSRVDFPATVHALLGRCGMLIEVGPGEVLTNLVKQIVGEEAPCYPLAVRWDDSESLHRVLATLFTRGRDLNWRSLNHNRLIRPYEPVAAKTFIGNPCEKELVRPSAPAPTVPFAPIAGSTGARSTGARPVSASPERAAGTEVLDQLVSIASRLTKNAPAEINRRKPLNDLLGNSSIKLREFLLHAGKAVGKELSPPDHGGMSLEALCALSSQAAKHPAPEAANAPGPHAAVQSGPAQGDGAGPCEVYAVSRLPTPPADGDEAWDRVRAVVACDPDERPLADELVRRLQAHGAEARRISWDNLAAGVTRDCSHVAAILPECNVDSAGGKEILRRLQLAATNLPEQSPALVALVQCGGLDSVFGVLSFAATLRQENPSLRVRTIRTEPEAPLDETAAQIVAEMTGGQGFANAEFDATGRRLEQVPVRTNPAEWRPRPHAVTAADIVLVTGGAQGITRECALGLARATKAHFVLAGRSDASTPAVQQALAKFHGEGLRASYLQCDLNDAQAAAGAVRRVEREIGPITVVVHGAGCNLLGRMSQATVEDGLAQLSPKLLGVQRLLAALEHAPPKLVVALTSIIGVSGLEGNAWYALANESLDRRLALYQASHPEADVQSIAYSVWGEVGMGKELGVVDALRERGIVPIPTSEGVSAFVSAVQSTPPTRQIVAAMPIHGLETWRPLVNAAALGKRFLERVVRYEAGSDVVARATLTTDRDPYLLDHDYQNVLLFPTVFGLEAMGQAALLATGDRELCGFADVALPEYIAVDPAEGAEIEIRASVRSPHCVQASIRTSGTNFNHDHFAAVVHTK